MLVMLVERVTNEGRVGELSKSGLSMAGRELFRLGGTGIMVGPLL